MSQFVDIKDYDASVHRDILDALVRDDETLVEICEDRGHRRDAGLSVQAV